MNPTYPDEVPEARTTGGRTALHDAAERGQHALILPLLRRGVDIDARDHEGRTALHVATHRDGGLTIRRLLQEGASPALASFRGLTPLGEALFARDCARLSCLIRSGISIHDICWCGHRPLTVVDSWGERELRRFLLDEAAAPRTPLTAAEKERIKARRRQRHQPLKPRRLYGGSGGDVYQTEGEFDAECLRLASRRAGRKYI